MSSLRQMGLSEDEIDELITALQRKIMEGAAHIQLRKNQDTNVKSETHETDDQI